ncbi:type VII secretion-associated serine protease mycosin [Streptomyces yunnanensis]|uniref:Type VII secretion-associated serine protease mycosin n=1 Tax=Streptomyces yunnanensis TaxID=156453 RepID=A0A9X8QU18_9ACTN|nr:type VII secretion-associated serine protease mycosin [Streptomyces yunnanensis]SHM09553.1 type VII secretion-associated serine protease mycosin [Streptomyces yunnanensis]
MIKSALRAATVALTSAALAVLPALPARADAIRAQQWGLTAIHAQEAWQTTKGAGITVAVLDTGVDADHPDLKGQVLPEKDLIGFGARPGDDAWAQHGTGMASVIAGHGHGAGRSDGILGVAPEARILPIRVILEDHDPDRRRARDQKPGALADGIRWAADHGADVINMSLGDDSETAHPDPREDSAIQYALGKGIPVVASAGNGGEKGNHISYPAAYPGVIAATAVTHLDARASFSTSHWYATVSAPGYDILMDDHGTGYLSGQGTSPAAAFVSGAIALIRSAHRDLSPAQIRDLLTSTAQHRPEGGRNDDFGAGLVDPAAALKAAADLTPTPQKPAPVAYPHRYFGPGPVTDPADDTPVNWLPWTLAATGLALTIASYFAWRTRPTDPPRHTPTHP